MTGTGNLTITLLYDKLYVRKIQLWIPDLKIRRELKQTTEIPRVPAGQYRAVLMMETTEDKHIKRNVRLNIIAGQENVYRYDLLELPEQVYIRPVNIHQQTILNAEIKIEDAETSFRPVHSPDGVPYNLKPGKYQVKLVLPDMSIRDFEIEIVEGETVYTLPVASNGEVRQDARVEMSLPVGYRTEDGKWYSTKSINISAAGICLLQGAEQPSDARMDQVFVRILFPMPELPVECYAKVRWKSRKRERDLIGLELILPEWKKTTLRRWLELAEEMRAKAKNIIHH